MSLQVLKPEIKQKWIDALKSAEYRQGKDNLYNPKLDSYCCLGVLEVVCGNTIDKIKDRAMPASLASDDRCSSGRIDEIAPEKLWSDSNRTYSGILAGKNDKGDSFESIADWIDENM